MSDLSTTIGTDGETTEGVGDSEASTASETSFETMTFDTARTYMTSALGEPISGPSRAATGPAGSIPKLEWRPIINAYNLEAGQNGLSVDDIQAVWKVITRKKVKILVQERGSLVLTMIPQMKIPLGLVETMLGWLIRSTVQVGFFEKVHTKLLIYLIGLVEYDLIDGNPFSEPAHYFLLFSLTRMHDALPLLCTLLKLVTIPEFIEQDFVSELNELRSKGLSRRALYAVNNLLFTYKTMRPKLVPPKTLSSKMIGSQYCIRGDFDLEFQKKLYDAQGRATGRPGTDVFIPSPRKRKSLPKAKAKKSAVMDFFFPEFQPAFDIGGVVSYSDLDTSKDRMFYCLVHDECLLMIIHDSEIFEQFVLWTSLIFRHKFQMQTYDKEQAHRYKFILDRCNTFTNILSMSLPSVDDWLPDYLITWDFVLFRQEIFQMIPRLNLLDFEDGYMCLLEKFERRFIDGNMDERLEVWETLEKLYNHWCELILADGPLPPPNNNERSRPSIVNTLFDFMCQLVSNYTTSVGIGEHAVLFVICRTYLEFMIVYKPHPNLRPPIPPMVLWYQVLFSDSFRMLDTFGYIAKKAAKIAGKTLPLYIEYCKFFQPFGNGLDYIFSAELKFLEEQKRQKEGGNSSAVAAAATGEGQDGDLVPIDELENKVKDVVELNCYNWKGLKPFRCRVPIPDDSSSSGSGMEGLAKTVFKFCSKDQAPFLIKMLRSTPGVEVNIIGEGGNV